MNARASKAVSGGGRLANLPTGCLVFLLTVVRLSGVVGAIVGFAISVVLTEVIFPNKQEWPIVINAALTVAGALAGTAVARNLIGRHTASSALKQSA